jgi:pilus assembly protein CpaC
MTHTAQTKLVTFPALLACLFAAAFLYTAPAQADKLHLEDIRQVEDMGPDINVMIGKGAVVPLPGAVSDVMLANSGIVEVTPLKSGKLYIVGLKPGDTNIITVDANGDVIGEYDVHVRYDTQAIAKTLKSMFPDEDVEIEAVRSQIYVKGTVSTPDRASKITNLIGHYVSEVQEVDDKSVDELVSNLLTVRGSQQVMLRVKIAEVSRTILKELGVETRFNDPNFLQSQPETFLFDPDFRATDGRNLGFSSEVDTASGLTETPFGILSAIGNTRIDGIGYIEFLFNALENDNLANVLAEPNLTAISGEQAGFLAGGEFPVPTGQDRSGNITIEFKPFGVSLNFKPVVLSDDLISLQMDTEVSSLDQENTVTLADVTIPGLNVRRAETTVELPSGGSMMIGGLLQSENLKGLTGLPGVMNTPVIGDLMKSDSFRRNETELVVIVTAYKVQPYKDQEQVAVVAPERISPLNRTFENNMRKTYGRKVDDVFEQEEGGFGYIIN